MCPAGTHAQPLPVYQQLEQSFKKICIAWNMSLVLPKNPVFIPKTKMPSVPWPMWPMRPTGTGPALPPYRIPMACSPPQHLLQHLLPLAGRAQRVPPAAPARAAPCTRGALPPAPWGRLHTLFQTSSGRHFLAARPKAGAPAPSAPLTLSAVWSPRHDRTLESHLCLFADLVLAHLPYG